MSLEWLDVLDALDLELRMLVSYHARTDLRALWRAEPFLSSSSIPTKPRSRISSLFCFGFSAPELPSIHMSQ